MLVGPEYHETLRQLEARGTDPEYIQGWAGGFLGNPVREEQRLTPAYEAGYGDGSNRHTEHAAEHTPA